MIRATRGSRRTINRLSNSGGVRFGNELAAPAPQILERFPHLKVDRSRKRRDADRQGERRRYAGVILATAGLVRLARESDITSQFTVDEMVPAAGQGIVVMETMRRTVRSSRRPRRSTINSSETAAIVERRSQKLASSSTLPAWPFTRRWRDDNHSRILSDTRPRVRSA